MRTLWWKFRYTIKLRSLLRVSYAQCWSMAGSGLENVNGDLSESPVECAQEEYYAWADCCD